VVDLSRDQVVVHRDPVDDVYGDVTVHGRVDELRPQHAVREPLRLSELFDAI
jgi:hypothetical protein